MSEQTRNRKTALKRLRSYWPVALIVIIFGVYSWMVMVGNRYRVWLIGHFGPIH